ncbi:filamentous hemagglutinin N-terminal domain-containing protein [Trichocoleus sp. FACHB-591]|uniref:two-partner secretion domain-containing protein n=1 Tax=Trichocoleus sp. FACHB-591 TaxID=2692872 RepID=UPI001685BD36|nr:filamentous hemagglutinin N-terminal domain-containing protein [Trichocoleus sp. FACHB-591]MBD2095690.1 filamentous hemagglutinin N-terminal domain-containing protein [Trichocoleus sp. FACHB-591]
MNWLKLLGLPVLAVGLATVVPNSAHAQITSAGDGTAISPNGSSTIDITGGTQAGSNLFHSFGQFNVEGGQTANFVDPGVQNILGRVTGGNASLINGALQVTGGNANLYLMNPAGIIFGSGASLNVPGSFTATTANGIGFEGNWFNAIGSNGYANLIGNPTSFAFTMAQPGAIVNAGNLAVNSGESITLLGGTVISTGTLSAPRGKLTLVALSGEKLVNLSEDGSLLSLALPLETSTAVHALPFTPLSLPQLLTGEALSHATGITVEDGAIKLTGSGIPISADSGTITTTRGIYVDGEVTIESAGDVSLRGVSAQQVTINASGAVNLGTNNEFSSSDLDSLFSQGPISITAASINSVGRIYGQRRIELRATTGDIVVRTIVMNDEDIDPRQPTELYIQTPGLFQAKSSYSEAYPEVPVEFLKRNIDAPENILIKEFLISEGILNPDGTINDVKNQINDPDNSLYSGLLVDPVTRTIVERIDEAPISISVTGDIGSVPSIYIEHSGRSLTTNIPDLTIRGRGSETQFVVGPKQRGLPISEIKIVESNSQDYFGPAISYQSFSALEFSNPTQFPATVSGTVGAIVISPGTNTTHGISLQNRPFVASPFNPPIDTGGNIPPEIPKPEIPIAETPKPEIPIAETPIAETPKPETPIAETPKPETPIAETPKPETPKSEVSDGFAFSSVCDPSSIVTAARSSVAQDRSTNSSISSSATSDPCNTSSGSSSAISNTTADDTQILKLLDEGVR